VNNFISGSAARELIEKVSAVLVDVRNPEEFQLGSVDGALNIPLNQIGERLHEFSIDQTFVLFCGSGMRSAKACMLLQNLGFENVKNVKSPSNYLTT